ncbi:hypothetical protein GCM10008904_00880 [Paraclostridium ghonii]|uniref:Uncharacterized protein n=1 Tax=Paraclostridium ghonii TaxID=29358 RepID=A0ABU0N464_9FIRM|nr:aureocin A53 family class IId bacteriocin [Paeniclostridium ghonii]MCM0165541.1 aureocin A53 family class IId bacteriocin [Paeniclostridium ghonii]MDQ0557954.1 hypothetical protein [Paeniclostridium ghonii]
MWTAILAFVAQYGFKAIMWCWDNKDMLISLGMGAFDFIRKIFG